MSGRRAHAELTTPNRRLQVGEARVTGEAREHTRVVPGVVAGRLEVTEVVVFGIGVDDGLFGLRNVATTMHTEGGSLLRDVVEEDAIGRAFVRVDMMVGRVVVLRLVENRDFFV